MKCIHRFLPLAATVLATCGMALASSITFIGTSATLNGGVNAQAVVTTGNGTVTIVLTNLIQNEVSVGQALSAFTFNLSNGNASTVSETSSLVDNRLFVGAGGASTNYGSGVSNWGVSGSGLGLSVSWFDGTKTVPLVGSGNAAGVLLGIPDGSGNYPSGNGSITTSSGHQPFYNGNMTFVLSVNGVTSNTTASDAVFYFNTSSGSSTPGIPQVPEPASVLLLGTGLLGLAWFSRRKFHASPSALNG